MTDAGKVFVTRLKVSCLQQFKEHLHLPFSKIPMHLQKVVIHDMETEFVTAWSVKKIKKLMSQNCKRFWWNQTKKIKKILSPEKENHGKNGRLMILGNLVNGNT